MKSTLRNLKKMISLLVSVLMLLNMSITGALAETIDANLYWSADFSKDAWTDVKTSGAIFDISAFEPGDEAVRYLKIENSGDLALSYNLNLAGESLEELSNAIDVYTLSDIEANTVVSEMSFIGTLADVIENKTILSEGKILPNGLSGEGFYTNERYVALGVKLRDDLGAEYMDKSTGTFSVELNISEADYKSTDKFEVKFTNTQDYLYRVGNVNSVALGSLFSGMSGAEIGNVSIKITSLDTNTDVAGVYTSNSEDWTKGTIKFSGTGPVEVTIDDDKYANEVSLKLEVVDATNVTSYSELKNKNSVLLNDITISDGEKFSLSNATLYGNGFTFDVTNGGYTGENVLANRLVYLKNASLDNIKIIGAVYTEYGGASSDNYNRATVLTSGNVTIANSYISNCAAPVRVYDGNVEIINTTLKGGNFANLDIRNGHVILDNVTTINQADGNDMAADGSVVVGLGVVVYYEQVLSSTTVEVKNKITQYNNISKAQASEYIISSEARQLANAMFGTSYTDLQYSDGSGTWVNTGIISMTEEVGDSNISDVDGYKDATPTFSGKKGYVHTKVPDASVINATPPEYVTEGQYVVSPQYSFDYTTKNYQSKQEGSNDYCYYANGTVFISMDEGESFSWDTSILSVTKSGKTLDYSVSFNGADYTGKSIVFDTAGDYVVSYTYTDDNNYAFDGVTKYSKTYTKNVYISVSVVKPDAKNAEFSFGSSGIASKTVTIDNSTYVMPDVTSTSSSIGSKTINGTVVYYPIVEAYSSDGKTEHSSLNYWYMCFPVFKNAVTITDFSDGGTGSAVTYDEATTSLPNGLSVENPGKTFIYASAGDAPEEPESVNGVLCYKSPTLSNNARNEMTVVAKYTYKDNAGVTFYYYVGYHCPKMTEGSSCVTPDTKVLLSDGSEKRIDELTYSDELLVWNFYKGDYDKTNPAIIFEHGDENNTVIKLFFEDGSEIKVVNLHQFFDITDNKFVNISEDSVDSYIGHFFVKKDGEGYKSVKLIDYEISKEDIKAYGVITKEHYNVILEGMLTTDFEIQDVGLFNYFEIGDNLTFNKEKMEADILEHGLYTYEDFEGYLTPELFDAFNVKYMKVAVGKGQFTYDGIIGLIEKWLGVPENTEEIALEEIAVEEDTPKSDYELIPVVMSVGEIEADISSVSDNTAEVLTKTIRAENNSIKSANYKITLVQNNNLVTLTASGTAKTGYAMITLDGDTYFTQNIETGQSITVTINNLNTAKDKTLRASGVWGISKEPIEENIIDLGTIKVTLNGTTAVLQNTTKYDITADVYVAVYNSGRLVSVARSEVTVPQKDTKPYESGLSLGNGMSVKAFVWEPGTMIPII